MTSLKTLISCFKHSKTNHLRRSVPVVLWVWWTCSTNSKQFFRSSVCFGTTQSDRDTGACFKKSWECQFLEQAHPRRLHRSR